MGRIGFVFEVCDNLKDLIFFNGNLLQKMKILVFVQKESVYGDFIVGLSQNFNYGECEIVYLTNEFFFEKFLVFENAKFFYAKISLSEKTIVDFRDITFWFDIKKYKELWNLFMLDSIEGNFENMLSHRVLKVLKYF